MGSEQIALKQGIVEAWAKVNLGLWVGPRHANGLHPVRSVMQTVWLGISCKSKQSKVSLRP